VKVSIEEKLDTLSQIKKGERIIDICHDVRHAHNSVHTIHDNADRITEIAKLGTTVFV
jgi:hypothetical protein